ncbi:unnamed protein product [Adineta ricciae]|uniref:Tudor domain-containing protein n=1 Tax=Adineta ricciae TaxID=249248 RepID=A0A815ZSD1_ADIRI|nr:unnamed protein product [Adineta ricciae]
MLTLVVEFGRQRRKFDLKHPIDIDLLENQIKSAFSVEDKYNFEYLIQIYDEQIHEYLDLALDSFVSTNNNVIKGQMISRRMDNSFQYQPKVSKQQVVGLITLESVHTSLQQWSQLLQHIQVEIGKELQTVQETINAVKSHYQLIDDLRLDDPSPIFPSVSNCSSPSTVSRHVNKNLSSPVFPTNANNSHLIRPIPKLEQNQQCHQTNGNHTNRRETYNGTKVIANRENHYYPATPITTRTIEYNTPVTITYQRFQAGVDFEGELSKYYNPSYFFLRISNQTESYNEMHETINSYYNSTDMNKTFFPQPGDFCVAKSPNDVNWYRARIIRLVGNEKCQLIFVDSGEIGELSVNLIQPLHNQFTDRPAQALACSLTQVLPFTQNEKCGWNRRACMSLENSLRTERLASGKVLLKVTIADMIQVKWPMMFIHISTPTISNLTDHMCDLYLGRRANNSDVSEYWSAKIRPEQFVLFNISSLINQKQYFVINNRQPNLSFDQVIDLIIGDLEFFSR